MSDPLLVALARTLTHLEPDRLGGYRARCPLHWERTPSFNISRDGQRFMCFGCGARGNAEDLARLANLGTEANS